MRPFEVDMELTLSQGVYHREAQPTAFKRYLDAAQALLRAVNINLNIGPTHTSALTAPWNDNGWITQQLRRNEPTPNDDRRKLSLALCNRHHDGAGINGMLVDMEHRSVIALFTGSNGFNASHPDLIFQILVHELGHAFNLVHPTITPSDPDLKTVMLQDDDRTNDRLQMINVWRRILELLPETDLPPMEAFYDDQLDQGGLIGLPFSKGAIHFLKRKIPESIVRPWDSPFRDPSDSSTNDLTSSIVTTQMIPDTDDDYHVGEPFDFLIEIKNNSTEPSHPLPQYIGMKYGNTQLRIYEPDGRMRRYHSRSMLSAGGARPLAPGERIRRAFSILLMEPDVVFRVPGEHVAEIQFPGLKLDPVAIHIEVKPARRTLLGLPSFLSFLGAGLPKGSRKAWSGFNALLEAPGSIPAATLNHLRMLYVRNKPMGRKSPTLLRAILEQPGGRRVSEKCLLAALNPADVPPRLRQPNLDTLFEQAQRQLSDLDKSHPALTNFSQ